MFTRKTLGKPDEVRTFNNGRLEVYNVGDTVIGRTVYEPGWRWSNDIRPIVGTQSCQIHHQGLVISGRIRIALDSGPEMAIGPGDLFEVPPGHDAWVVGDEPWVSVDFSGRRYFAQEAPSVGTTVVTTILFTDLVESTSTLASVGNAAWRELLADHNVRARAEIDRHRGREVATTGDGLLAIFESPTNALRAASAILGAARSLGLRERAGVHSGEVLLSGADVRGIAVHAAARVMAAAAPDEVLVSRTTRDLVSGSNLRLESRGAQSLKGLTEPMELFVLIGEADRPSADPRRA